MQRTQWILGFLLTVINPAIGAAGAESDHDFHYSRFGLEWNAQTGTWQGILRVFTDDLEVALSLGTGEETPWRLGDEREHNLANEAIAAYATSRWSLLDSSGLEVAWQFIGKEVDYDITFIYLESTPVEANTVRDVKSEGFFEMFEDQVNEVTLNFGDQSLRIWLTQEDPLKSIATENAVPHD
jgi:hypothetical protein